MGKFDDDFTDLIISSTGEVLKPTDPVKRDYMIRLDYAWQLWNQGDDSLLVEMGIYPQPDDSRPSKNF